MENVESEGRAATPLEMTIQNMDEGERRSPTLPRVLQPSGFEQNRRISNGEPSAAEQPIQTTKVQEQSAAAKTNQPTKEGDQQGALLAERNTYEDPEDPLWAIYNRETERVDRALAERWKGDMDGLLIFAGLFSAVITAFIIESYKSLTVNSGDTTVALLNQISLQLAAAANGSQFSLPSTPLGEQSFQVSSSAVRVNVCWFLSLSLSLATALAATLVQQWSRSYFQGVQRREIPRVRARIRSFLHEGVETFHMSAVVDAIPALLHVAVFLFLGGLVEFLIPLNKVVGYVTFSALALCGAFYASISLLPIQFLHCPYRSPLTPLCWRMFCLLRKLRYHGQDRLRAAGLRLKLRPPPGSSHFRKVQEEDAQTVSERWKHRELSALQWTLESLTDHRELHPFIEALPGYLRSSFIKGFGQDERIQGLFANKEAILRASNMLSSCMGKLQRHEHQSKYAKQALATIRFAFSFGGLGIINGSYEPSPLLQLLMGVSSLCAGESIPPIVAHEARCAMVAAPMVDSIEWLWGKTYIGYDSFSGAHWTSSLALAIEESCTACEWLRAVDYAADRRRLAACVLVVYAGYLFTRPEFVNRDISKETFVMLAERLTDYKDPWDKDVQHLYVSFCARLEGLHPGTPSEPSEHLNVPTWVKTAMFNLLMHVKLPEERARAIKILKHAEFDPKDDQGPLWKLLEVQGRPEIRNHATQLPGCDLRRWPSMNWGSVSSITTNRSDSSTRDESSPTAAVDGRFARVARAQSELMTSIVRSANIARRWVMGRSSGRRDGSRESA